MPEAQVLPAARVLPPAARVLPPVARVLSSVARGLSPGSRGLSLHWDSGSYTGALDSGAG